MKQDQYPAYTMLTNSALSNAIALECIIKAYIDEQETEFLESAFCIASEQVTIVRNIRDILEPDPEIIKLAARSIGVSLMVSSLAEMLDTEETTDSGGELPEAILTMIRTCILSIKTIRCKLTSM
ncbi:Uncharacterised protein [Enterobacter cloacae]|uniref:hypothetical protein n=1 Tax=Enterobacter cloacae TaxID=550 RepID=UPI000794EADD|nr:hypothetical protein [Enterobacter cloacae]SAH64205.1 Uncharacterised protein [Enterobacter cloacae]